MTVITVKQPPIRIITQGAFLRRIDSKKRILIRKLSTVDSDAGDNALDVLELLRASPRVRLDFDQVIDGLNFLKSDAAGNILTDEDIVNILADGTESERY